MESIIEHRFYFRNLKVFYKVFLFLDFIELDVTRITFDEDSGGWVSFKCSIDGLYFVGFWSGKYDNV